MNYLASANVWLSNTTSGSPLTFFQPTIAVTPLLPSVADRSGEWAHDRDAKLTPLEWLDRQVGDVCRLAALAL